MKKIFLKVSIFLFTLFLDNPILAQRGAMGRYHPEDRNIGLPPLGFTGKALIIGIILLGLGWIISKIYEKPNGKGGSSFGGLLMILGIICLVPGFVWLQTVVVSLWMIGAGIVIVILILSLIWEQLTKK